MITLDHTCIYMMTLFRYDPCNIYSMYLVHSFMKGEIKWSHLHQGVLKWIQEAIRRWAICTFSLVEPWTFELGQNTNIPRTPTEHQQLATLRDFA